MANVRQISQVPPTNSFCLYLKISVLSYISKALKIERSIHWGRLPQPTPPGASCSINCIYHLVNVLSNVQLLANGPSKSQLYRDNNLGSCCVRLHVAKQPESEVLPRAGYKDTSSVWNFCARFSDVISRENQWWPRKMSAFFSGQRISSLNNAVLINCLSFQIIHAVVDIYGMANMVSVSNPSSGTLSMLFRYSKNPRAETWFLRTCQAKISPLGPIYTKTCLA